MQNSYTRTDFPFFTPLDLKCPQHVAPRRFAHFCNLSQVQCQDMQGAQIEAQREALWHEVGILRRLRHRNIITFIGISAAVQHPPPCFLMEFCAGQHASTPYTRTTFYYRMFMRAWVHGNNMKAIATQACLFFYF
jgi:hypothetical protein